MLAKIILVASSLIMVGCSSLSSNDSSSNQQGFDVFEGSRVVHGTLMSVPDYYSTQQVEQHYKLGRLYKVSDLRCKHIKHKCTD